MVRQRACWTELAASKMDRQRATTSSSVQVCGVVTQQIGVDLLRDEVVSTYHLKKE
jgi:hypothetical protein